MLQEIWATGFADYWSRRADVFDSARPVAGGYTGGPVDWSSGQQLEAGSDQTAIDERLAASADECRARADELRAEWEDIS